MASAHFWVGPQTQDRGCDVNKPMLYKNLELEASRGATLRELEAEIDREGRLLTVWGA